MSNAAVYRSRIRECGTGMSADFCQKALLEMGELVRCGTGKIDYDYPRYHYRLKLLFRHTCFQRGTFVCTRFKRIALQVTLLLPLRIGLHDLLSHHDGLSLPIFHRLTRCRVGLHALRDCSHLSIVGCLFKYCGYDGGSGLQFGFSSSSTSSSSSSSRSSNIGGGGSSKSFGSLLNHCVISFCGESAIAGSGKEGGGSDCIQLISGSSAEFRRCTITQSAADSIRVLQGSTITMRMCCVHASSAAAVVFGDRGTGKLINCQVLAAAGNGLELSGAGLFVFYAHHAHVIALLFRSC
jgi:hypothetical protein